MQAPSQGKFPHGAERARTHLALWLKRQRLKRTLSCTQVVQSLEELDVQRLLDYENGKLDVPAHVFFKLTSVYKVSQVSVQTFLNELKQKLRDLSSSSRKN